MSNTPTSSASEIGAHTRQEVQLQTLQNLVIGIASMSADLIPDDLSSEWQHRFKEFADQASVTYQLQSVDTIASSNLTKKIDWRKDWMAELPNWSHAHWGGLTAFGTYIVQETKEGKYLATAFSGAFYIGTSETPETAFQVCQDDLDSRIKEMLL